MNKVLEVLRIAAPILIPTMLVFFGFLGYILYANWEFLWHG